MDPNKKRPAWIAYALEFIVVIFGILLAFQLDRCSRENEQRKTIAIHLEQIRKETAFNKKTFERSIKLANQNLASLDTTLWLILSKEEDYKKIDSLSKSLLNMGWVYIRKNAYQNLLATGDIRFLNDFHSKQKIIDLYEYYKWVEAYDNTSNKLYDKDYFPYLKQHFDLVSNKIQEEEVYRSKLFINLLGAYKFTTQNRLEKYKDCLEEIEDYLSESISEE